MWHVTHLMPGRLVLFMCTVTVTISDFDTTFCILTVTSLRLFPAYWRQIINL